MGRAVCALWAAGCFVGSTAAQAPEDTAAADTSAVRVFLDCQGFVPGCDFDFFRTEITFVNYVRDRRDAEVHILMTSQATGGGGREVTLTFLGFGRFSGAADTLRHTVRRDDSDDDARRGLVQMMRLGLVRFAAQTPLANRITIAYTAPPRAAARATDPWNYWVFRIGLDGNYSAEASRNFLALFPSVSATRITAEWKIRLSLGGSYNESHFRVPVYDSAGAEIGNRRIVSVRREYTGTALLVNSLGPHWSVGVEARAAHSLFRNQDLQLRMAPAIEYNFFPYGESTRRQFTLRYAVGLAAFDYMDTTVFNKTSERLGDQTLLAALDLKQPWGAVELSFEAAGYVQDLGQHHLTLFGEFEVRIVRGLSLNLFGSASRVKDQRFVAKTAGATPEEVLLQRRALETDYRYFAFFGLRYSFGSKFDNIVNPRFPGSSGGVFFF
ncbi:MAG TPA: hypothetical protein VNI61_06030 [Gemmatimonadales bacterium]|nr:hypothetical protein [Gemmatimonadales bacterium]